MRDEVFVTGGCGYVGSLLVEKLTKDYAVTVLDTHWFGNYLKNNENLKIIKGDIRYDLENIDFSKFKYVIHLANIANDPGVELDQVLSWEVNVLASKLLIEKSISGGVEKFIYASSGSVYGIKHEEEVTEDLDLVPLSVYNKTKMISERIFLSYKNDIDIFIVRPATVCGWSPRMRLDVSVNMLTYQALKNKKISVFGGNQTRPNININDMISVYFHMLENQISPGIYNAGFENMKILDLAKFIKEEIETEIEIHESNDPRSYRQSSKKLLKTGFQPKFTVRHAISDLKNKYINNQLIDHDSFYTVKWMKKTLLKSKI